MAIGLAVGAYLGVYIFVTKGAAVLFGAVIPYVAGRMIYSMSGGEGVWADAIAGVKEARKRGEKVKHGVEEALKS